MNKSLTLNKSLFLNKCLTTIAACGTSGVAEGVSFIRKGAAGIMTMTIYGDPEASTVLVQMVDDHDLAGIESELAQIQKLSDREFCLIAVKVSDWNHDLSPWEAPAVFGREDFGGGAAGTLEDVLEICRDPDRTYIIGGYSLAGLFALWAAYQTDVFAAAASASPSVWFPGFADYMEQRPILVDSVYLSLGDREEKTRNQVMATVGDRIREAHKLLTQQGVRTELEWNKGGHFKEADLRTARAFAWAMGQGLEQVPVTCSN